LKKDDGGGARGVSSFDIFVGKIVDLNSSNWLFFNNIILPPIIPEKKIKIRRIEAIEIG